MSEVKLVLAVKIHELTTQVTGDTPPSINVSFISPKAGTTFVWEAKGSKGSGFSNWAFNATSPDFNWDDAGSLLIQILSGDKEMA